MLATTAVQATPVAVVAVLPQPPTEGQTDSMGVPDDLHALLVVVAELEVKGAIQFMAVVAVAAAQALASTTTSFTTLRMEAQDLCATAAMLEGVSMGMPLMPILAT